MLVNTISEAKAQLSALITRVQQGEEVIIARAGTPVAVLVPFAARLDCRKPGALKGRIRISDDFDELSPEIAAAFGIEP